MKPRLLVIDDDALVAKAMSRLLSSDYDIVVEDSARAALIRLYGGEHFDRILCDLMMPGTNGMKFYELLQVAEPALARRCIFMTGGVFGDDARAFLEQHHQRVLHKPVGKLPLLAALGAAGDSEHGAPAAG